MILHIHCLETMEYARKVSPTGVRYELPYPLVKDFTENIFYKKDNPMHPGFHQLNLEFTSFIDGQLVPCTQEIFAQQARKSGYDLLTYWENGAVCPVTEATLRQAIEVGADSVLIDDPLLALQVFADYHASILGTR